MADNPGSAPPSTSRYISAEAIAMGRLKPAADEVMGEAMGGVHLREQLVDLARLIRELRGRSGGRIEIETRCTAAEPVVMRTVLHVPQGQADSLLVDLVVRRRVAQP